MDVEQRIGLIHRYGQAHTAQVYNLVLSDTIEGRIFLLLSDKLDEIASTLGKVDEGGNVAEDLRTQILGQLSERLSYDALYREALSDPELRRTKEELNAAMSNATEARKVVFELFQDLDRFSLDDYQPFADVGTGFDRIVRFLDAALREGGRCMERIDARTFAIPPADGGAERRFTTDRDVARAQEGLELIGLDHPLVVDALRRWQSLEPEMLGVAVDGDDGPAALSWWLVHCMDKDSQQHTFVRPLAINADGARVPKLEREGPELLRRPPNGACFSPKQRLELLHDVLEPMLQRELQHRGLVHEGGSFHARLIGWAEVGADITRHLNELFADPELRQEQVRTAAELDAAGTDWGDERW